MFSMFHKTQNIRHVIGLKFIGLINIDFLFNIKLVEKKTEVEHAWKKLVKVTDY